jgi:hypothetical protein
MTMSSRMVAPKMALAEVCEGAHTATNLQDMPREGRGLFEDGPDVADAEARWRQVTQVQPAPGAPVGWQLSILPEPDIVRRGIVTHSTTLLGALHVPRQPGPDGEQVIVSCRPAPAPPPASPHLKRPDTDSELEDSTSVYTKK